MNSDLATAFQNDPCFDIDDPSEFRQCLCEMGVTTFCAENVTTANGGKFWDWDQPGYGVKHSGTVKNVVVQRRDYENNATQSWGLFMILMGIFPIGVLFVCFFACNYRRRWVSRSSLSSRPWPSGNILEAGRATPASLASAELEPLVSPPAAPLVSPELSTSPAPDAPPSGRPGHAPVRDPSRGHVRHHGRLPAGGLAAARHLRSEDHLHSEASGTWQRRSPSPALSEASLGGGRTGRASGPPPSYSQTLLDVQPPSYEAACGEDGEGDSDGAGWP